jgi:C-terminal processing protease CtpA/Prc
VFKKLPNRYYLQMAIADYETGLKARIEGVGVSPDEEVGLSPSKLRRGEDSVIKAATKWILRQD